MRQEVNDTRKVYTRLLGLWERGPGSKALAAALSIPAPTFVVSSTKAAMVLAAGQPLTQAVVGTHVLDLAQEVIKSMFLTKLKLGTAAVFCAGLFMAVVNGTFFSLSLAQDAKREAAVEALARPAPETATSQKGGEKPGNGKADQPEKAPEKGERSPPRGKAPSQDDAKKVAEINKEIHEKWRVVNEKAAAQAAVFAYPGAKRLDERAGNVGVTLAGSVYQSLYTTPDELSKVAKWYDKKVAGLTADQPGAVTGEPDGTRRAVYQDGEQLGLEALAKRPVSTRTFLVRTKTHTLSVVLCRPPSETLTVILLTYLPE